MLVLSRKRFQSIKISDDITITVVKIEGNQVRLGIEAPRGISIVRSELLELDDLATSPSAHESPQHELITVG